MARIAYEVQAPAFTASFQAQRGRVVARAATLRRWICPGELTEQAIVRLRQAQGWTVTRLEPVPKGEEER